VTSPLHEELIAQLLDESDRENGLRQEFESCMPRAKAELAIRQVLALYGCRNGSAASIYAALSLEETTALKRVKIDPPSKME
jgi:hypothetical protein